MDVKRVIEWMKRFEEVILAHKDELSQLDTPIGDGDHGGNMARGMTAVVAELDKKDFTLSSEVFKVVAMQLLSKVGGASGPLYGSAFMGMAKVSDTEDLAVTLQAGLDMIQKRGHAELGEKTMVDVWQPVIEALEKGELTQDVIRSVVEATRDLQATKGRASYVGERSIGHIDPGSASSGLLFETMLEVGLA